MRLFKPIRENGKRHRWFAWFPVLAWEERPGGRLGWVWWEDVDRIRLGSESLTKYSYITQSNASGDVGAAPNNTGT